MCPATAEIGATFSRSITMASNIAVNREPGSAHGTRTSSTPCSGHSTRGTSAVTTVRISHVSR